MLSSQLSLTYPDFLWTDQYRHHLKKAPQWLVPSGYFSKILSPNTLKMNSLALSVLRFFCKTFSKLLKFTL